MVGVRGQSGVRGQRGVKRVHEWGMGSECGEGTGCGYLCTNHTRKEQLILEGIHTLYFHCRVPLTTLLCSPGGS